ncbi:hypothetical protein ACWDA7_34750 [Streptomyces sp. NPDC001156]
MNNTARPNWARPPAPQPPGWAKAVALLAGVVAAVWVTWCSAIALIGGTMPLVDYHTGRSVPTFLLMLFIGEPILIAVAYWTVMLATRPIALATTRRTEH